MVFTPLYADASVYDGTLKKYTKDGQYKIDMSWEPAGIIYPDTQYVFNFKVSDALTENPIHGITFELDQVLDGKLIGESIKTSSSEKISTSLSFDKPGFLHLILSDINNSDQEIDFSFPVVSTKDISKNGIQYVSKVTSEPQMYFCGWEKNVKTLKDCFKSETYENYGWQGKVNVLIYAPGWNSNSNSIQWIGNTSDSPISVTAQSPAGNSSLDMCGLIETGSDTGLFVGRLKLSGMDHDLNGDGIVETGMGGTSCKNSSAKSPLKEFAKVETDRNGGFSVTWKYDEDKQVSKSATYNWNMATISFEEDEYFIDDTIKFKFYDKDLYGLPKDKMPLDFKVWSDSDQSGIILNTAMNYKFKNPFEFMITSDDKSNGNTLYAQLGDSIYVEYEDCTLPVDDEGNYGGPYTKKDTKIITAQTTLSSELPSKIILR